MAESRASTPTTEELEGWRGVAAEETHEVSERGTRFLRDRSKRLLSSLVQPFWKFIPWLVVLVIVENAARLAMPMLVQRGLDDAIAPMAKGHGTLAILWWVVGLMLFALASQVLARTIFLRVSGRIGQALMLELRRRVFSKFQSLDVAFHDRYTSGRAVARLTSDMEAIQELFAEGLDSLITAVLTLFGVGILLVVLDWRLGLICLLSFPVLLLAVRWFSVASTKVYRRMREASALTIVQFVESMTGMRAVQAYRREPRSQVIFEEVAGKYRESTVSAIRLMAIFMPVIRLTGNITIGVVLMLGGLFVIDGSMSIGVLAAFLLYLRMFFEPMSEVSQFYNTFQSAISALEKLSGVLEEPTSVPEPSEPTSKPAAKGKLSLENVHFAYVEDRPVLPNLTLTIPAGKTLALVGTTGAGKTTIVKLLSRFYDPTSGSVRLDGVPLRDLSDDQLRRHVVMVTQENFMFGGSIADNIAFGKPEASREEIEAAGRAVGLDAVVAHLPDGYDTDTGKKGSRLSAGQRQLVAFARAFLADPAVLILDEATSSLDVPSERLVQRALQTVLADRTAIIIAHRLSTVDIADRVIVLEHGEIIEDGSPGELVTQGGHYAGLYHAWEASLR